MNALLTRMRDESGQAMVFVAFALVGFVGLIALVVDGGSWFRTQRQLQTAADAGALAAAQELPLPGQASASTKATTYADTNFSGATKAVTFPSPGASADCPSEMSSTYTVNVCLSTSVSGIFTRIYGAAFDSVTVRAHARASVSAPTMLKNVAPIAVYKDYACIVTNPSCFGQTVVFGFDEDNPYDPTKSKYGLLDLDRDGSAGAGDMKNWLANGYSDYLPVNTTYPPANGEKNGIKKELDDARAAQRVLLFPVYDSATPAGYNVIGWAAFVIDSIPKWTGKDHILTGHFTTFVATDLAAGEPITDPSLDFGVHVITLTR